jgi:hypothetical protein
MAWLTGRVFHGLLPCLRAGAFGFGFTWLTGRDLSAVASLTGKVFCSHCYLTYGSGLSGYYCLAYGSGLLLDCCRPYRAGLLLRYVLPHLRVRPTLGKLFCAGIAELPHWFFRNQLGCKYIAGFIVYFYDRPMLVVSPNVYYLVGTTQRLQNLSGGARLLIKFYIVIFGADSVYASLVTSENENRMG